MSKILRGKLREMLDAQLGTFLSEGKGRSRAWGAGLSAFHRPTVLPSQPRGKGGREQGVLGTRITQKGPVGPDPPT